MYQALFVKLSMRVHNFTLENPFVFETDPSKNRVCGRQKCAGQNCENIAKAHVGYQIKGNQMCIRDSTAPVCQYKHDI